MEFSVCPPPPPNTYSYVREENLGSTRKFVEPDTSVQKKLIFPSIIDGQRKKSSSSPRTACVLPVVLIYRPLRYLVIVPSPLKINLSISQSVSLSVCKVLYKWGYEVKECFTWRNRKGLTKCTTNGFVGSFFQFFLGYLYIKNCTIHFFWLVSEIFL